MPAPDDNKKVRILEALRVGPLSSAQIATLLATTPDRVNKHLRELTADGDIIRMTSHALKRNEPQVYRLAEKTLRTRIRTLLAAGPATTTQLGEALCAAPDTVLKALRKLHAEGCITATLPTSRRLPITWSLL